jgi:cbb3-type cytochrome oxidase subunit 3
MHLSDIMGHAGLSGYAIVAMILFLLAFLLIAWNVFRRSHRDEYERLGSLPLDDERTPASAPGETR